jgi:hypothetical protein
VGPTSISPSVLFLPNRSDLEVHRSDDQHDVVTLTNLHPSPSFTAGVVGEILQHDVGAAAGAKEGDDLIDLGPAAREFFLCVYAS